MGAEATFHFGAHCARCGNRSFEPPRRLLTKSPNLVLALPMTCSVCKHRTSLVEFADAETVGAIIAHWAGRKAKGRFTDSRQLRAGSLNAVRRTKRAVATSKRRLVPR
jgi:hypothetical protein